MVQIFIERQYFDGGKQTEFYAENEVARPSWLPEMDVSVGLTNTEGTLNDGEACFEIVRLRCQGEGESHWVTWVGCYRSTFDLQRVGRGATVAGLGLWLVDTWVNVGEFVRKADVLLGAVIPKEGGGDNGSHSFKNIARQLLSFLSPELQYPIDDASWCKGLAWGELRSTRSVFYRLPNIEKHDNTDEASDAVVAWLNHHVAMPHFGDGAFMSETHRAVLALAKTSSFPTVSLVEASSVAVMRDSEKMAYQQAFAQNLVSQRQSDQTVKQLQDERQTLQQVNQRLEADMQALNNHVQKLAGYQETQGHLEQKYPELLKNLPALLTVNNSDAANKVTGQLNGLENLLGGVQKNIQNMESDLKRLNKPQTLAFPTQTNSAPISAAEPISFVRRWLPLFNTVLLVMLMALVVLFQSCTADGAKNNNKPVLSSSPVSSSANSN